MSKKQPGYGYEFQFLPHMVIQKTLPLYADKILPKKMRMFENRVTSIIVLEKQKALMRMINN